MGRGRRSAPGRRSGVGADSAAGGADDDDEETGRGDIDDEDTAGFDDVTDEDDPGPTSAEDLASTADPGEFDETFTDDAAPLSIAGNFDPSAGPKQVIPRIAFVLNYNLVYNAERDRWEPQKKSDILTREQVKDELVDVYNADLPGLKPAVFVGRARDGIDQQTTQPSITVTDV